VRKRISQRIATSETSGKTNIVCGDNFGKPAKVRLVNSPKIGLDSHVIQGAVKLILASKTQDQKDNALYMQLSVMPQKRINHCMTLAWIAKLAKGLHRKNETRPIMGKPMMETKKYESGIRPLSK
jgi:hypothetical protein